MHAWVHFFVGTPKRFLWTMAGLLAVFAMIFPTLAQQALFNVLNAFLGAVNPLVGPLLTLLIVVLGFYVMFKPLRKKKKGGGGH